MDTSPPRFDVLYVLQVFSREAERTSPRFFLVGLIPYGLVLGVFGIFLPPLLFSIGMPHVGSGLGTILTASELPMAILMSSLVLAEHVSWFQWIGVLIILVGIVNSNIGSMSLAE